VGAGLFEGGRGVRTTSTLGVEWGGVARDREPSSGCGVNAVTHVGKGRLGHGVVLRHELELDHIAHLSRDLVGVIDGLGVRRKHNYNSSRGTLTSNPPLEFFPT
jgi:hypothetical protein